ncbi:MAG TPA: HEAT repeat domain-containing protein [Puia sp.]|jgi:hypothetical protein|nr:HEAT repeat domain-containing protein [Puia sp.]
MSNELEKYILENLDQLDRKKPDAAVLDRVLQEMRSDRNGRVKGKVIPIRLVKWAAACLLVLAIGMVVWNIKRQAQQPGVDPVIGNNAAVADRNNADIALRQNPELAGRNNPDLADRHNAAVADEPPPVPKRPLTPKVAGKQAVLFADLHTMQSAASRINAIQTVSRYKKADKDVVDALERILNNDPNSNVRLATLDILARFYRKTYVRKRLAASLKRQQDPVVQIELISLLIRMRESGILSELEKMANDENTNRAVKDISYSGILQLSSNTN